MNGSHVAEEPGRPWFNWYTWRLEYWDTKWGAYDGYTIRGKSCLTFVFSTAWSVATPIIKRLKVLGYDFSVMYADECWGSNCGKFEYDSETGDIVHLWEDEAVKDTYSFSKRIWDEY